MTSRTPEVVVIGAGPGGLATAMLLAESGIAVTVVEKRDSVGGRTSTFEQDGFQFDVGPTFFLYPKVLREIFSVCGYDLDAEVQLERLDPQYRLVFGGGGELLATPDVERMERAIATISPGDATRFRSFLKRNRRKLDSMVPLLQKPFTSWGDLLRPDVLKSMSLLAPWRSLDDDLQTHFKDERIRLGFSFQSKYLGMSPFRCPSLFSILSFLEYEHGVFHPIGGCGALTRAMARIASEMGVKILLDEAVEQVLVEGKKAVGVKTATRTLRADAVVMNAEFAEAVRQMIPNDLRTKWTNQEITSKKYSCSTFMMYLGIEGSYDDVSHHTVYLAKDYKANLSDIEVHHRLSADPSFYVQNASVTDASLAPSGHSTLYVLLPVTHASSNVDWEVEKKRFRRLALDQLTKIGIHDLDRRIRTEQIMTPAGWAKDFGLHKGATFSMAHSVDQMLHRRPQNRSEDLERMYLVGGGTHPGSGLPIIFESARISSRLLLQDLGMAPAWNTETPKLCRPEDEFKDALFTDQIAASELEKTRMQSTSQSIEPVQPHPKMRSGKSIGIIGSGLAGLAATCTLAARGYRVQVFEKNAWLGGKAAQLCEQGFRFDMGPTILIQPSVLRKIFAEAGCRLEDYLSMKRLDPQWRCFFEDKSVIDLQDDVNIMASSLEDLMPTMGAGYLKFLEESKQLHSISNRFFFWKSIGTMRDTLGVKGAFDLSVLRDVMRMRLGKTVSRVIRERIADPNVAQMLDHFVQYVGSSPDASPAILCAIGHMQMEEGIWYPVGGTRAIPEALIKLANELGVVFHPETDVTSITRESGDSGRATGLCASSGVEHQFDAVISNADAIRTHRELIGGETARIFQHKRSYEPACSGVVLYLGLNKRYDHLAHHNFVFSRDPREEFHSIYERGKPASDPTCYLAATASTDPDSAPVDGEALYVLVHTPYIRSGQDWNAMFPAYRQVILDKLKRTAGLSDIEDRIVFESSLTPQDIHDRYRVLDGAIYGISSHGVWNGAFKPANRSKELSGLYLAGGAAHPGPGMPMVLMSGWIAADSLDQDNRDCRSCG